MRVKKQVGHNTRECLSGVVQAFQIDWLMKIGAKWNDRGLCELYGCGDEQGCWISMGA